jgi:sugar O-acyltransferase (sialic acid O-acetyltransferase NeuD family)
VKLGIFILGAGGHAWVVADILLQMQTASQDLEILGYLDDNLQLHGKRFLGLPVLGALDDLSRLSHDAVVVAIGDNTVRRRVFTTLYEQGESFVTARHPRATIAGDVALGTGTMICAGAIVNPGSTIGVNVILNTGCTVDHHNRIGDHAHIAPGGHLGGEVTVGAGTLVGIGATVMPRRTVGARSVIGAGSLVSKDVPDLALAVGMPARVIRRFDPGSQ